MTLIVRSLGSNTITAVATNLAGNTSQAQDTVVYAPPGQPLPKCDVPDVLMLSLKLATQELVSNNCTVGKVRIKVTKLIPAGRVYGQSLAGTGYPDQTKVNLTVAQHPKKKKKKHAKHGSKHHKAKRLKRVRYRKANKATVKASFCAEPPAAPRINAAAYHEPGRAWLGRCTARSLPRPAISARSRLGAIRPPSTRRPRLAPVVAIEFERSTEPGDQRDERVRRGTAVTLTTPLR